MKNMTKILIIFLLLICAGCSPVSDDKYYAIDHFYFYEEGDEFKTAFNKATIDVYNWYSGIEGEDGVYILHSEHYNDELLDSWRDNRVFGNIPDKEFWYFAVSENYLYNRGYELNKDDKQLIRAGVRLYLLPDKLSKEEGDQMKEFLKEDALYGLIAEPLIKTSFETDQEIEFKTYHSDISLETEEEGEIRNPIIFVCSSENMRFFESESLIATGKKDSYIKLTRDVYEKYAGDNLPEKLKERSFAFLPLNKIKN